MLLDPSPSALDPIAIVFVLFTDPCPALYPRNTLFETFDEPLPAPAPRNVVYQLLLATMFECGFPAPIPT